MITAKRRKQDNAQKNKARTPIELQDKTCSSVEQGDLTVLHPTYFFFVGCHRHPLTIQWKITPRPESYVQK